MWVSDLNSAYFVYNPAGDTALENFQKTRFDLLRSDTDFTTVDQNFLDYYTQMPQNAAYQAITALAQQITAHDTTNIDRIIALRNYFLSKDEFGQPLFQYTDNPGVPGLPDANKLTYFLFENRKGYCAYFAGATLFMLRALHIPSRIATGFLTIDRSSKNPGWYWFYEDQAHAWVQVFFPKYGWLDFDTTIPDVNTQQAPQPDGTPPLGAQKVYFVGDGFIQNIDTAKKTMQMLVNKILYRDVNYTAPAATPFNTNIAFVRVNADTGIVSVSALKNGMHVSVASYSQSLDSIRFDSVGDTAVYILTHLKQPVSIDDIKIIEKNKNAEKSPSDVRINIFNWEKILIDGLIILCLAVLLVVFSPWLIWQFYQSREKISSGLHARYRAVLYYLNQMGYSRRNQSPQAFAQNIDGEFGTNFVRFNQIYQKEKCSPARLSAQERAWAKEFYPTFMQQIKNRILWKKRTKHFFSLSYTLYFFIKRV
jgi:transglutaminase-like putative cysteine protease